MIIFGAVPYAEGTWTPTVIGSTTPGTQTYAAQTGYYTKIGNRVIADFRVITTALDGAIAGNVLIGGLPFPALTDATMVWTGALRSVGGVTHNTGAIQFAIGLSSGQNTINLVDFGATSGAGSPANIAVSLLAAATSLGGSISYRVA